MSQVYTDDCFAGAHEAQTDLQNMENNFAALKSLFSGTGAPSNTVAGMPWFDTTKKVLKCRNAADAAWVGLMHGDVSQKLWVYRNAAMDGWAIDSGVSDTVLAIKGGSTYVTGGAGAGSWTISGLSAANESAHTHTGPSHTHTITVDIPSATVLYGTSSGDAYVPHPDHTHTGTSGAGGTGATGAGSAHNHTISHDGSARPAASVGTLQYLDL